MWPQFHTHIFVDLFSTQQLTHYVAKYHFGGGGGGGGGGGYGGCGGGGCGVGWELAWQNVP